MTHALLSQIAKFANLAETANGLSSYVKSRDKGKWRTMTKFEIRNNTAYVSQMQFEVLRRALWVQQAYPDTGLQLAVLGNSRTRSEDDFILDAWCESEDV